MADEPENEDGSATDKPPPRKLHLKRSGESLSDTPSQPVVKPSQESVAPSEPAPSTEPTVPTEDASPAEVASAEAAPAVVVADTSATAQDENVDGTDLTLEDAEELIRAMGLVFSNTFLYGVKHSVTSKAMDSCFLLVSTALDLFGEIAFQLIDEAVMVNTVHVSRHNPLVEAFAKHLADRELMNFSLGKGMTREVFGDLMEVMNATPDELRQLGGFAHVVQDSGIENVKAQTVVYKKVTEDEVVVSKDSAGEGGTGVGDIKSILGLLRTGAAPDKATSQQLKQMSSHTKEMGEAIVEAAEEEKKEAQSDGTEESLTQLVIDSLKRLYSELSKDKSIKTQKGKKELTKTLTALEGELKQNLLRISSDLADDDFQMLDHALEEMTDELKIDALVSEYMKKRSAIDKNEQRILRFMKSKGLDKLTEIELEKRLEDSGLSLEGWHELLAKSGLDAAGGSLGDGVPVVGHLAELLKHIQNSVTDESDQEAPQSPEEVRGLLTEIDQEVRGLVAKTKVKIKTLVDSVHDDAAAVEAAEKMAAAEGQGVKMSRKKLFEVLAEIVQELCQPLAVISCSLDMLGSGCLGEVSEHQSSTLQLAGESAEKLKVLIDNLQEISGLPTTMSPDAGIQSALYDHKS